MRSTMMLIVAKDLWKHNMSIPRSSTCLGKII